jgi:pyridoxal phosphate enzyme (YggS family)
MVKVSEAWDRIRSNVLRVQTELERLRGPDWRSGLTLVAVTKTVGPDEVRALAAAGVSDFGENRPQELVRKVQELPELSARWHMIGHLQTNKVKATLAHAGLIHSVDSLKLALEIDKQARAQGRTVQVLVEVNVSGEASKGGFAPPDVARLADELSQRDGQQPLAIEVAGLMTMAPLTGDETVQRSTFRGLARLRDELAARAGRFWRPVHLSMGMSNDYRIAVEEGATMIRVGSALFADR